MRPIRFVGISLLGACLGLFAFAERASAGSIGLVPDEGCISYASTEGTVYFCDTDIRPTGTGVIDPFLRVQRDGDPNDGTADTYSSGWNTDAKNQDVPTTNDMDQAHTESLLASDVGYAVPPPLQPDGAQYAIFSVDINQEGNEKGLSDILSLNQFELFNCGDPAETETPGTGSSSCTSFFDLFAAGDWVNFDYRNHTGSGSGDIDVYIPATVGFGTEWISLLDGWGCGISGLSCDQSNDETGLFADNDGFQEWFRVGSPLETTTSTTTTDDTTTGGQVPEPASMLLLGAGLAASGYVRRRQNRKAGA